MPESYTHIRTARRALKKAELTVSNRAAFDCGANGPDMLFCYRIWRSAKKRGENLPELGSRLHRENTGVFLRTLIQNAHTPGEKSYVLGFLSHYAADRTVHPYIAFLSADGQPYAGTGGHGYSEIAIDSELHQRDTGRRGITVNENVPKLTGTERAEVGALLQKGIQAALGVTVSQKALEDTFRHTRWLRRWFCSPCRILYGIFWLAEPFFGGRSFITCHITPAKLKALPAVWKNPYTGEQRQEDLNALLKQAECRSAEYMKAVHDYWNGQTSMDKLSCLLGSASYDSGLEDAQSAPVQQSAEL